MPSNSLDFGDVIGKTPRGLSIKGRVNNPQYLKFDITVSGGNIERRMQNAINRGSARAAGALKEALDAAMRSGVWGQGDPDIYDTGALMASGRVIVDGAGLRVIYDEDYAALIHYGGYIVPYGNVNARVYLPPKPWVDAVLRGGGPVPQFDFTPYYVEELRKELGR